MHANVVVQVLGTSRVQVLEHMARNLVKGKIHEATVDAGYVQCLDQVLEFITKDMSDGE